MAKHTIVAQFRDYGAGHRAYCELIQIGIRPDDISLIAGDRSDHYSAARDFGILALDVDFYIDAVRRGATLLAVRADDPTAAYVAEIIQEHAALGIEEAEDEAAAGRGWGPVGSRH